MFTAGPAGVPPPAANPPGAPGVSRTVSGSPSASPGSTSATPAGTPAATATVTVLPPIRYVLSNGVPSVTISGLGVALAAADQGPHPFMFPARTCTRKTRPLARPVTTVPVTEPATV